jgi:hypothetical protein
MRDKITFSVKKIEGSIPYYTVKVVIENKERSFKKGAIWDLGAYSGGQAIDAVMKMLLDIENQYIETKTEEELKKWDNVREEEE